MLRSSRGMIDFYGSFHYQGSHNIILECADQGSLEDYFREVDKPSGAEDIAEFWSGMFAITEALMAIHETNFILSVDESKIHKRYYKTFNAMVQVYLLS
jgi:serine/threonine protein kinase